MKIIVTGSLGLVGLAACKKFLKEGHEVIGIDCDARKEFFGADGSNESKKSGLFDLGKYRHLGIDICDKEAMESIDWDGADAVIHAAAQPAHDWATQNTRRDFEVNAIGTLNVLECVRKFCPNAAVCHFSTSKVYGDNPNNLPLEKTGSRLDLPTWHDLYNGIPETFSVDNCLHSFFGCSKLAGDIYAQEYGKHLGLKIGIFRPGCITGSDHAGVPLHGFLAYLAKCLKTGTHYEVIGYNGLQVRCNIHADDLVDAFCEFMKAPKRGEVYNMGGRELSCSMLEAIRAIEDIGGKKLSWSYNPKARTGDHKWYISDTRKFRNQYNWKPKRTLQSIFEELVSC